MSIPSFICREIRSINNDPSKDDPHHVWVNKLVLFSVIDRREGDLLNGREIILTRKHNNEAAESKKKYLRFIYQLQNMDKYTHDFYDEYKSSRFSKRASPKFFSTFTSHITFQVRKLALQAGGSTNGTHGFRDSCLSIRPSGISFTYF